MFRHYLIAALRNMAANRLQSAIAIIGLAIGITAALLMALIIHNQLSFDHFIPGRERTYLAVSRFVGPGQPAAYFDSTPDGAAALLKLDLPEIESTARLMLPRHISDNPVLTLKRGEVMADEVAYWADPNAFDVLPLPVSEGDPAQALRQPDGIVLPRAIARKYFGRADALGQIIQVDGHPMTVRAVIEDLPANGTSLQSGIFASGLASFSPLTSDLSHDTNPVITYLRLKPGASLANVERRLPALIDKRFAELVKDFKYAMLPVALDRLPLLEGLHPGATTRLVVTGLTGVLVLFIAAINFVNLLTTRAAGRALEVGMRKVCGADRRSLVLQFLGEAVLTVFFAACIAVALSEWLLPPVNAFLGTDALLDDRDPLMLGVLAAGIGTLGLLAGAYPAFVLASFRPAGVLKGMLPHAPAADRIRAALVALQFAILIGLAVSAAVVYQQNRYATREGLRGDIDQMLVLRGGCKPVFRTELRKLSGVAGVSCTDITFFEGGNQGFLTYNRKSYHVTLVTLDPGVFALYGIKPLAGSLPPASAAGDRDPAAPPRLVLNAAAARQFGFASPEAAIGQTPPGYLGSGSRKGYPAPGGKTIAVIPDFSFQALADQPIPPTVYTSSPNPFGNDNDMVSVRLRGRQIPETLAAIDQLWRATNPNLPVSRFFLGAHMQELYLSMLRQAQLFAVFSGVAVLLACLGLLGLSFSATDRRTKEIGVRKAMGARDDEIVALLLWQFSKPVLWANLIAWPLAWWAMNRWLNGFAYHVPLSWWLFPAAGAATLLIALLTVAGQAKLVARQKPVLALRYE